MYSNIAMLSEKELARELNISLPKLRRDRLQGIADHAAAKKEVEDTHGAESKRTHAEWKSHQKKIEDYKAKLFEAEQKINLAENKISVKKIELGKNLCQFIASILISFPSPP